MTETEKVNNFINNITKAGAIVNKKGKIVGNHIEGDQIYFICSIEDKEVDTLYINDGTKAANDLKRMFTKWSENPIFITPNLESFVTYTEC